MSLFLLEPLLNPISDDEPSGPDLEYDPAAIELEQSTRGKPEQQFGDTIVAAEEPDWKSARQIAIGLLSRAKDIRFVVHYGNASLFMNELEGFKDATSLILSYITDFWSTVHPQLDPDDDNDPTARVNAIASMRDPAVTLRLLRSFPVVSLQGLGRFSFNDIQIAKGEVAVPEGTEAVPMSTIEGAFQDCDVDQLGVTQQLFSTIRDNLKAIESKLTETVGVQNTVSLEPITSVVSDICDCLSAYVQRRGGTEPDESVEEQSDSPVSDGPVSDGPESPGAAASSVDGEIRGREDVIRSIDRICSYYERYEPSSPLPLLLLRAKRLATKSFLEIIRDLAPDGLNQANAMGGTDDSSDAGGSDENNNEY
jgi:type VI secretion system protein ImpA